MRYKTTGNSANVSRIQNSQSPYNLYLLTTIISINQVHLHSSFQLAKTKKEGIPIHML